MAFESLFSSPPNPALDKRSPGSEHDAGEDESKTESDSSTNEMKHKLMKRRQQSQTESDSSTNELKSVKERKRREDGELEDGEIDDVGVEEEKEKPEAKEEKEVEDKDVEMHKNEKTHRKSRKKYKKEREKEKKKPKRKRRDKYKHNSPSSGNSSDYSFDSDEPSERSHKKGSSSYRDFDRPFIQHGHNSGNYMSSKKEQHNKKMKTNEYDEYTNYSEDKFGNYFDEEEEDFADQLNQYRQAKETNAPPGSHFTKQGKQCMKGSPKDFEQQCGNFRGRGMQKKFKHKERGRGRGSSRGPNSFSGHDSYREEAKSGRKWVTMSQEFINQHTVEHKGKQICKYFLEGRCIKGDDCKFDHDAVPQKKKEVCKFYIQGYCSKGDNCFYMHLSVPLQNISQAAIPLNICCSHEFPCKFFHTGAKCFQEDNCKFSHDPLTDDGRMMLDKVFNAEEEPLLEDQTEFGEFRRRGMGPPPKPPPGRGLLPTPPEQFSFSEVNSSEHDASVQQDKMQPLYEPAKSVDEKHIVGRRPTLYNSMSPPGQPFRGSTASPQQMYCQEERTGLNANFSYGPNGSTVPPSSPSHPHMGPQGYIVPQNPHLQAISPGFMSPHNHAAVPNTVGPPPPVSIGAAYNIPGGHTRHIPTEDHCASGLNYPQNPNEKQHAMQQESGFESAHLPPDFYDNYYSQQVVHNFQPMNNSSGGPWIGDIIGSPPLNPMSDSHSTSESDCVGTPSPNPTVGVPDFLPAMQKALFARINQKQQHDGTQNRSQLQRTISKDEVDETVNWYSSSEEDEGSSVKSILKTLKKQTEIIRKQQQNSAEQMLVTPSDPRLAKERNVGSRVTDPRVKSPVRPGVGKGACSDPRVVRDPRKLKPSDGGHAATSTGGIKFDMHHNHPGTKVKQKGTEDDEEDTERELREKAVPIPLECLPGVALRDPRSKLRQFSHIKKDIILTKPNFAKVIVWAPEDLLPIPLPKPDPVSSINLPLPPLIADQTLNKARHLVSDSLLAAMPADPRLGIKTKNAGMTSRAAHVDQSLESHAPVNKQVDPRLKKHVDPRLHRLPSNETSHETSKDSLPPKLLPRIVRAGTAPSQSSGTLTCKSEQDLLPPYAPKLSASGVRTGTPHSILRSISLYDPREHISLESAQVSLGENGEHLKKPGILKNTNKIETDGSEPSFQPKDSVETFSQLKVEQDEEKITEVSTDAIKLECSNNCQAKPDPTHSNTAPAVHNLPIQALAGLIRPQYCDSRQIKQSGLASQMSDVQDVLTSPTSDVQDVDSNVDLDDKPLKDVFKTFDPTASPFCYGST